MDPVLVAHTTLEVLEADLTRLEVEAIVNAANGTLLGGGGVDGAIHRAAGRQLRAACLELPELRPGVRCEVGMVRVTPGFRLPARHVLHTVGPVWRGGGAGEPAQLARCYRAALAEVARLGLSSVGFPAISTGAYGYPAGAAAEVAAGEAVAFARGHPAPLKVVFACFDRDMARLVTSAVAAAAGAPG